MKTLISILLMLALPFIFTTKAGAQSLEMTGMNAVSPLEASAGGSYMVSTSGAHDGKIVVYAAGGQGSYMYSLNGGKSQTSNVFKGLPAGTYSVKVMDASNRAVTTNPLTIYEPAEENESVDLYYDIFDVNRPGWPASDETQITRPEPVFYNVFTPNGDGVNDAWAIGNIETYPDNRLMIFNVSGQVVYSQEHYQNTWTGSGQRQGMYFYVLTVNHPEGNSSYKGAVALLK